MLNVCFGESECGMLKLALDGESVTFSHRALEFGLIHPNHFEEGRRAWIGTFFAICSKEKQTKIWQEDCKRFQKILDTAKQEKQLRIWCANNASSKCGLYHLIHALKDIECSIYIVEMPSDIGYRHPPFDKFWGEAYPDDMHDCLKLQRKLTKEECNEFAQMWETLAAENAALRLNVKGCVTSLPIDYLDDEILSHVPASGNFSIGRLVGETLGNSVYYLCDTFVSLRVESMIDRGIFTVVEDTNTPETYYKTLLCLSTAKDEQG